MSQDPAFLFYSADFLTGTGFLSFEQKGKYITLLSYQHLSGHLSEENMLKVCGDRDPEIWAKFKIDEDGKYYNERLENEIQKRKKYSESRRNNRNKNSDDCIIYMVKNQSTGQIKISASCDPERRILELRKEYEGIELSYLWSSNRTTNQKLNEIHLQYNEYRVLGEWFRISDDQINDIKNEFLQSYDQSYDSRKTNYMENRNRNINSINFVFKEGGCKGETKHDEVYEEFKKHYPENGSAISEEVRRQIRSMLSNGFQSALIVDSARNYSEYCRKQYPKTYPYEKHIKHALNWLKEEQFNIKWDKMTSEIQKPEMGTHVFN